MIASLLRVTLLAQLLRRARIDPSARKAVVVLAAIWAGAIAMTGFIVLGCIAVLVFVLRS